MISSPPEQAEHIRGKTLTPESPKPQYYPSPSNIPILEMQMDPLLNEPALSIGTPASFQYPQQTHTPSAHSSTSYYAESQPAHHPQNGAVSGTAGFAQMSAYNGASGAQAQNTPSNHGFPSQEQPALSTNGTPSAPAQEAHPAYPFAFDANAYAAQQPQAQSGASDQYLPPLDVQALLDRLSTPASNGVSSQFSAPSAQPQSSQSQGAPSSTLPAAPNLPPRPPPQSKPATHPNYNPNDDIRSYHPHSGHRGSTQLQPLNLHGGTDEGAKRSNVSPTTPSYPSRQALDTARSSTPEGIDEDSRWPPHVNKQYEDFLDQERKYVTEGQWDQFPMGSRLFIGNLPTEKVTKRDIFHRFYRHGQLAQISIKQAYGFVQFLHTESCSRALQAEQGQQVRGRKMHLEVSKPQRNTKKADPEKNTAPRRRSPSPDFGRGGSGPQARADQFGRNQNAMSPRDRDRRFRERDREDFRARRSPSPRDARGYRGRERSQDRYDQRRRSRSRSPRRFRSPSPRPRDGLPLPPRPPHRVPEVQILAQESLPKDFVQWVEDAFQEGGLRVNVLRMSPRLDEGLVEQRQIIEGVLVIVRLDSAALASGKISLQVFDRRGGADNVRFDTYANLDLPVAIALVHQAKQKSSVPVQPALPTPFGQGYGAPPTVPPYNMPAPTGAPNAANLSNLFSALSPDQLAQLLAAMPRNSPAQTPQPQHAGLTPELARLLSAVSTPTPTPTSAYNMPPPPPQSYANPYHNPAYTQQYGAHVPIQQQPAQPVQPVQPPSHAATPNQPDMNEIMAQLAKYQR